MPGHNPFANTPADLQAPAERGALVGAAAAAPVVPDGNVQTVIAWLTAAASTQQAEDRARAVLAHEDTRPAGPRKTVVAAASAIVQGG